jgi:hypothetical protein
MPLLVAGKTSALALVTSDPRPTMQRISNKIIVYPYTGVIVQWAYEMWVKFYILPMKKKIYKWLVKLAEQSIRWEVYPSGSYSRIHKRY